MKKDLNDFVTLSKYAGERFDLTQAGGGNTSVQLADGTFLVKSSGINLSEVSDTKGFVCLNRKKVFAILQNKKILLERNLAAQEKRARVLLDRALISGNGRPSIEAYMHVLFDKFTLHTHSIAVNILACRQDWRGKFLKLFPDSLCIDYATPGIRLALAIQSATQKKRATVIFIQNHGLITTGPTAKAVMALTEKVIGVIEKKIGMSSSPYKLATGISQLINRFTKNAQISYLSTDTEITKALRSKPKLFFHQPFSPDGITFCGVSAVRIKSLSDTKPIQRYVQKYRVLPKVIIYQRNVFLIAPNVRKAKEIEDVLRFQLIVLTKAGKNIQPLSKTEMDYLTHWEAEQYRQQL